MTQTEQNWTVENTAQSEEQTKVDIKTKKETIKKHRQLTCQVMEEMEQLFEETQTEKNEIDFLKIQTEQQKDNIERLTSEKHEQYLLIKRLKLQIENVIEKLQENKNTAIQEKAQLLKILTEIYQERETLDRRRYDIINERRRLDNIKYDRTMSQANNEPKKPMEQIEQMQYIIERLMTDSESVIDKNRNIMVQAKMAQEQIEETIANTKQELKRIKSEISQHRDHVDKIKHTMNVKINKLKQKWANTHREAQMQKAAEMESRERQRERKVETVKVKLSRIQEDMEKVWDVMEYCEQQLEMTLREKQELKTETSQEDNTKLDSHKQQHDTDESITVTQCQTEIGNDMQKQDIESKLAQIQSERAEIERLEMKIQRERENIERERQQIKAEMDAMKCMKESAERQNQELDNKLLKTKTEMREMEVMGSEIEMKKKELAKMIRVSRRKMDMISKMKEEGENSKQDMEERQRWSWRQKSEQVLELNMEDRLRRADRTRELMLEEDNREGTENKVSTGMHRVTVKLEDIKKLLHLVRDDTEQSKGKFAEEKSQIKWMKFQAKKTIKERTELDIMKLKIQQQGEKVEQKLEDAMTTILSTAAMNTNIEKAAAEINNTRKEMLRTQRKIGKNKEEVKKYMDKLSSMKAQLHRWILTQSPIKKTFVPKLHQPQKETGIDSVKDQTLGIPAERQEAEDQSIKETLFLRHEATLQNWHQSEEIKEQAHTHSEHKLLVAMGTKEEQSICLQIRTEIDGGALIENDETEFLINVREKEEVKKQISKLKEQEEEIKEQIKYAMENMEEKDHEIKRLIMEINDLQSQRPAGQETEEMKEENFNNEAEQLKKARIEEVKQAMERELTEQKRQNMNHLQVNIEKKKNEIDDLLQKNKREIREMELLKSELEMKRKESERIFRKNMRKKNENEILWNEVQEEKKSLRRETRKRRRELDQKLEKNTRQRDELEVLRIKLRQQTEELAEERMRIKDLTVLINGYREHEKHSLEKKDMKSFSKVIKMVHERSEVTDSITDLQNITQKFHVHAEIIIREMGILENVNVHLRKQRDGLKALKTENMNVIEDMNRVKSQIKDIEKMTILAKAEMDKMVHIRDDIQKQKQELDIKHETAKRERQEMEVLISELEMKKRENQQIIRKCIQTEQEGKRVWAAIKEEKDALKRETQKRKRELNKQLERIIRERDELEIMNRRLKSEKDESRSETVKSTTSAITEFQNQFQKHWERIKICREKYEHMKSHCALMMAAMKDEKHHIQVQGKITALNTEEVANIRIEMKHRKEMMTHELKKVQQYLREEKEQVSQIKADLEIERKVMLNESDRMERDTSELKLKEDQVKKGLESMETLRDKLQWLHERMSKDIKYKMDRLQQNSEAALHLQTVLEQKLAALDGQKNTMDCYTEMVQRQQVDVMSLLSEMTTQRDQMENEWKQKFEDDKQHLMKLKAELKQDKDNANTMIEMMNKEKVDLKVVRSDILKQTDLLERDKQDMKAEKDKLEITKAEFQITNENNHPFQIRQENEEACEMKEGIGPEKEMFSNEQEGMAQKPSEIIIRQDHLCIILDTIVRLRRILKLLTQKTQVPTINIDRFEHNHRNILKLLSILGHKCDEIDHLKNVITCFYHQIQCEKNDLLKRKFHKAVQTEAAVQELLHEHEVQREDLREFNGSECKKDVQQSHSTIQTDKWEHQRKSEEDQSDLEGTAISIKPKTEGLLIGAEGTEVINAEKKKLAFVSELSAEIDYVTEQERSKRDCLRKIWKETRTEQKDINQMKCWSHDMRNSLEQKLEVINQFVKKTLSQKEKTPKKKTKPEKEQSQDTLSQNGWNGDYKSLSEKCLQLQQLKIGMLSQFEKLHITEKVTLTTSNRTNQKIQVDIVTDNATVQAIKQASTKIDQEQINAGETEEAPETCSGFMCQLWHCCYRCCCCARCKQVFPKEK